MLTPYSQTKFVEKVLTNAKGEQFRVVFCVTFVNGEVKAQIVSATPLARSIEQKEVLCLPACKAKIAHVFSYKPSFAPIFSPLNDFFFFTSQPTRAPSF